MSKPDVVWAFWANMFGPWWTKPKRAVWSDHSSGWWTKCGEGQVNALGLEEKGSYLVYASRDKADVEKFIAGFESCRALLAEFFDGSRRR